jgi:hypothetical protein
MSPRAVPITVALVAGAVLAADAHGGQAASRGGPAAAPASPARARVLGCRDRISGAEIRTGGRRVAVRFAVRPTHDARIGPVAFSGALDYGRPATWAAMVRGGHWLKSVALVRPGARVTLVIPPEQRAWMRLEYGHGAGRPVHTVTLEGCRRRGSAAARRRECGPGPQETCRAGPTPFSGGFTIDYARAPAQGRCAELIVRVAGRDRPLRERLYVPRSAACP